MTAAAQAVGAAPGSEVRASRFGWLASPLLHALALAAGLIALPPTRDDAIYRESAVVPVDLVEITGVTDIRAAAPEAPIEPLAEIDELGDGGALTPLAPPPEPIQAAPGERAAPAPTRPREPGLDYGDLEELLIDRSRRDPGARATRAPPDADREANATPRAAQGAGGGLTATEEDALRAQMRRCWRAPVDQPNAEQLIVRVRFELTRDGDLAGPPRIVGALSSDPGMRAAADAALRAVRLCAPYRLPVERYAQWREITMRFDPSEMLGR